MKSFISACSVLCFIMLLTVPVSATQHFEGQIKVAFVRDKALWINENGVEKEITKGESISNPTWSHDGEWLAYKLGKEEKKLYVYSISEKRVEQISPTAGQFEWSPHENKLAFLSNNVLNVTDVNKIKETKFENVALGVGNFSWHPNGQEFIVSSSANLLPTGWTSVELFTVSVDANLDQSKIKHFYTLPKDIFAVMTSSFKWSEDGKWISFIAIPTASIAMDSNSLCVLSSDGKSLQKLGEMLYFEDWFQWAPYANRIVLLTVYYDYKLTDLFVTSLLCILPIKGKLFIS